MKIRVIRNPHSSALVACINWLAGSPGGHPLRLSNGNYHVYGWNRRTHHVVYVEFRKEKITVLLPWRGK